MAIMKIQMRPEGDNDYEDIVHPETSADMVLSGTLANNMKFDNDTSYGLFKGRNIASGISDPSGGENGDIYFKRKE